MCSSLYQVHVIDCKQTRSVHCLYASPNFYLFAAVLSHVVGSQSIHRCVLGALTPFTITWSSTIQLQSDHPKHILMRGVKGVISAESFYTNLFTCSHSRVLKCDTMKCHISAFTSASFESDTHTVLFGHFGVLWSARSTLLPARSLAALCFSGNTFCS